MHIEISIYETYIVKEISIFTLYYFESHLRTIINHILRNNVDGELSSIENFSIFDHPRWPLLSYVVRWRYLTDIKFRQAHTYLLFNYDGLTPFVHYVNFTIIYFWTSSFIFSYKLNSDKFLIVNIINYCYLEIQMLVNLKFSNYKMNNLPCGLKHV